MWNPDSQTYPKRLPYYAALVRPKLQPPHQLLVEPAFVLPAHCTLLTFALVPFSSALSGRQLNLFPENSF